MDKEELKKEISKRVGTYQTFDFIVKCSLDVCLESLQKTIQEQEEEIDILKEVSTSDHEAFENVKRNLKQRISELEEEVETLRFKNENQAQAARRDMEQIIEAADKINKLEEENMWFMPERNNPNDRKHDQLLLLKPNRKAVIGYYHNDKYYDSKWNEIDVALWRYLTPPPIQEETKK